MKEIFIKWLRKLLGIQDVLEEKKSEESIYEQRKFMTNSEIKFYRTLLELGSNYNIVPQVNLATIVRKKSKGYINELFKNIDFVIFDKNFDAVLLLIELNDSTHEKIERKDRDLRVKKICNDADLKLMTFYTKYPNETNYVISRIKKEIESISVEDEEIPLL